MKKLIIYIHGKEGSFQEAERFSNFCVGYDVFGIDYDVYLPWVVHPKIKTCYDELKNTYANVSIIAESIGAYFAMYALQNCSIEKAYLISPILDMEKLIMDMMQWASITEKELYERGEIATNFGETLSWNYLKFVRENPIVWHIATEILYAEHDNLTSRKTVDTFVNNHDAGLTIMKDGEHWFHTDEQVDFLNKWIKRVIE